MTGADNPQDANQSDRLRDRIANAIYEANQQRGFTASPSILAGAVIAELGLHIEWGIKECSEPAPGWLGDTREELTDKLLPGETMMTRYITYWKTADE